MKRIFARTIPWLFLTAPLTAVSAEPTHFFQEWGKVDVSGPFDAAAPDWRYEAFVENRNQETRLDFSSGYRVSPLLSFWQGFTWISPNDGKAQAYRPWQQVIWELLDKNPIVLFQTRTRLEELKREGQPEVSLKLRERWRVAFPNRLGGRFTPVIYDEIFLNLNQPSWVSTEFVDQNRVFIGIDSPSWHDTFVELGYINQYIFTTPANIRHILAISFMIRLP